MSGIGSQQWKTKAWLIYYLPYIQKLHSKQCMFPLSSTMGLAAGGHRCSAHCSSHLWRLLSHLISSVSWLVQAVCVDTPLWKGCLLKLNQAVWLLAKSLIPSYHCFSTLTLVASETLLWQVAAGNILGRTSYVEPENSRFFFLSCCCSFQLVNDWRYY